jgi:hypothetical protein
LENRCLLAGLAATLNAPWRGYDTGSFPNSFMPNAIAAADMDADGDQDVVVGRFYSSKPGVSVLLNQGDGTYGAPTHYNLATNESIGEVTIADIDADGDPDVVATIPKVFGDGNRIAFWRNNGAGNLTSHSVFTTGSGPVGLAVADFTGDGFLDVATANYGPGWAQSDTISLLRHNGLTGAAAGFLAPVSYVVGVNPQRLAARDVNGDGHIDLAVGWIDNVDGIVTGIDAILVNDGTGGFLPPVNYFPVPQPNPGTTAVGLADLDNDGDPDLIGAGASGVALLTVRRNAGDGTFGALESYAAPSYVPFPRQIVTADLNGDGFRDVLAAAPDGRAGDGWIVLLSNGSGGFQPISHYRASQQTMMVVPANVDHDTDIDVVTVARSSAAIAVHRNLGNGTFFTPPQYQVGALTEGFDYADLDGDGDFDIVTGDDRIYTLKNNGKGAFAPATTYIPPLNSSDIKLRDLNGDNRPDLLMGPDKDIPPYHFATALNNGDGTFAPGIITFVNSCGEGTIDAFDLDNDGDRDVVLTEEQACGGFFDERIFIARNDGAGNLTLVPPIVLIGYVANGLGAADFNHDGNLDLITSFGDGMAVFLGNGDLTFQPPLLSSNGANTFTLGDMNRDGDLDVLSLVRPVSFGTEKIGIAFGNGDGTFMPAAYYAGSSVEENLEVSTDIDTADINHDGQLDVLVTNFASNDVSLFLNKGNGMLGVHQRYGVGYAPLNSGFADFTHDGVPDAVTVVGLPPSGAGNVVVMLRGQRLQRDTAIPNWRADGNGRLLSSANVDPAATPILAGLLRSTSPQSNATTDDAAVLPSGVMTYNQKTLAVGNDNSSQVRFRSIRRSAHPLTDGVFTTWKVGLETLDTNETS